MDAIAFMDAYLVCIEAARRWSLFLDAWYSGWSGNWTHKYYDNGFDTYISTYSPSFICEGGLTGLATSQLSDR